jgi:hypothetical protein
VRARSRVALDRLDALERRLRDSLGLEATRRVTQRTDLDRIAWHTEPLRGRALDGVLGAARDVIRAADDVASGRARPLRAIRRRSAWRELARTRHVRWVAHHHATTGVTDHVDGRIVLASGRTIELDISCLGTETAEIREAWQQRGIGLRDPSAPHRGVLTLLVPAEVLTPQLCEEALVRWYMQHVERLRGHWAIVRRTLPSFELDAHWSWPEDPGDRASAGRAVGEAYAEIRGLDGEPGDLTYPHFGRTVTAARRHRRGF